MVVADDVGRHAAPAFVEEVDRRGLENEVADGHHEPGRVDHHAAARALAAERVGGAGLGRNLRAHAHDRRRDLARAGRLGRLRRE